jgi:hypothetical protein
MDTVLEEAVAPMPTEVREPRVKDTTEGVMALETGQVVAVAAQEETDKILLAGAALLLAAMEARE